MIYARKGSTTLAQAKTMLNADPLFNLLSSSDKTVFINAAVQRICNLRNQNNKEDYAADTVDITAVSGGLIGVDSYGPTANRPVFDSMTHIGYCYYDTDISSPVFWSGTEWT